MSELRIRSQTRVGDSIDIRGRVSTWRDDLAFAGRTCEAVFAIDPLSTEGEAYTWRRTQAVSTGIGFSYWYLTGLNAGVVGGLQTEGRTRGRFAGLRLLGQQIRNLSVPDWPDEMMDLARRAVEANPDEPTEEERRRWIAQISEALSNADD